MARSRSTATPSEQEEAILKAAAEEVALVGIGRASMDVVARQAGVSRSTLYRRFPSRDLLITQGEGSQIRTWWDPEGWVKVAGRVVDDGVRQID